MEKTSKNLAQFKKEEMWLLEEKYHGEKTRAFFLDIARLKKGEPIDYIIGFTPFLGCHIDLSELPLIPRTETELWVERAIEGILNKRGKETLNCLDLFSGSGCVGIALAHHLKSATVDFGDNNKRCLKQIQKNIQKNKIKKTSTNVYESDCFENIPEKKYDYIFANPPYISKEREKNIQESVLKWEPHDALFAKDEGLYFIKKIIQKASDFLNKNGTIFIEFDSCQKERIETELIPKNIYKHEFWKDQFGKWRVVVLQKNNKY